MPRLSCSVSNCSFYSGNYCCKNQINVGGENAKKVAGTCCESFVESSGAFTNSTQMPNTYLNVTCDAEKCVYNSNQNCMAQSIAVAGVSASTAEQTECATFACK